ncbi:MAG: T9SS type A sorting domain-containing protein [Bacteroidetes bacterium]|nr:T9SS type A sorting domain-containing protein [Bacteroidota bacterium]
MSVFPNPASANISIKYHVAGAMRVTLKIYDSVGNLIAEPVKGQMKSAGTYVSDYSTANLANAVYFATISAGDNVVQSLRINVAR